MYSANKHAFNYDYIKKCKKRTESPINEPANEIQDTIPINRNSEENSIQNTIYNTTGFYDNFDLDDNMISKDANCASSNDLIDDNDFDEEFDSNAYLKNKLGYYFRCDCGSLPCTSEESAYFVIANPKNSGVNLFLNVSYNTNLSEVPLNASVYYFGKIKGDLKENKKIISGNPYTKDTIKSKSKIYYGANAELLRGINTYTFSIDSFSTFKDTPSGSIIIAPGYIHVVKISSNYKNETGLCCASFAWWEQIVEEDN